MSLNFKNKNGPDTQAYNFYPPGNLELGFNTKDILGDIPVANPPSSEPPVKDSMDYARHVWRKGTLEFMGGPTVYSQGHGVPGYLNQDRVEEGLSPLNRGQDQMANQLNVDTPEN